ncbi:MAG: hypothetical protein ABIH04_07580 [Planctomycetota bacterium]
MRRIAISCFMILAVLFPLSCRGTDPEKPPEEEGREEGGEAAARREKERKFHKLLGDGEALLKTAVLMEKRETEILKKETDSQELRKVLEAQRATLQQAMGCYKQALLISPDSFKAHQGVAQSAVKLGRYDEAIEHGKIVLGSSKERWLIYRVLAGAYGRKGEQAEGAAGLECLRKAAELMERYTHQEKPPMLHKMREYQAWIYVETAGRLTGAARAAEYDKAIALLDAHLAAYPELKTGKDENLLQWGRQMETMLEQLKAIRR